MMDASEDMFVEMAPADGHGLTTEELAAHEEADAKYQLLCKLYDQLIVEEIDPERIKLLRGMANMMGEDFK